MAQPACTAIQLALVDMLASWNVKPDGVTGHSSGEIAAAYACGAISFETAMCVAYARGVVANHLAIDNAVDGTMLAAGLSEQDAKRYIAKLPLSCGSVRVACINSPRSVTVSGDTDAIVQLHDILESQKIFVRKLPVDVAYHSHICRRLHQSTGLLFRIPHRLCLRIFRSSRAWKAT